MNTASSEKDFEESIILEYKCAAFRGIASALSPLNEEAQELMQTEHQSQKDLTLIQGKLNYDTFLETILDIGVVIGSALQTYPTLIEGELQLLDLYTICDFVEFYTKTLTEMCMKHSADIITAGISEVSILDDNVTHPLFEELCPIDFRFFNEYIDTESLYPAITLFRFTGIGFVSSPTYLLAFHLASYLSAKQVEKIVKSVSNEKVKSSTYSAQVSSIIH